MATKRRASLWPHAQVVGEHPEHVDRRHFWSDDMTLSDIDQVETGIGQLVGVAVLGADEDDRGCEGLLGFAGDPSQSSLGCLCFGIVAVIGECQVRFVDDDGGVVAFLLGYSFTSLARTVNALALSFKVPLVPIMLRTLAANGAVAAVARFSARKATKPLRHEVTTCWMNRQTGELWSSARPCCSKAAAAAKGLSW